MKISEMKKVLKEMKDIANFDDSKTDINVVSPRVDPFSLYNAVELQTEINGVEIRMVKDLSKGEKKYNGYTTNRR